VFGECVLQGGSEGYSGLEEVPATPAGRRQLPRSVKAEKGGSDEDSAEAASSGLKREVEEDSDDDEPRTRGRGRGRPAAVSRKRRSASEPAKPLPKKRGGKQSCIKCLRSEKAVAKDECLGT
jgi:hypothetical protein